MSPKKIRTCVIYVRLSKATTEESVSIDRQLKAGHDYAKARGWRVVGTFKDDGVSASSNKPEDRKGWKALLAHPERYDAVIVWKIDRLARRTLDFLNANEAVKERGAGIVAVEDPIDMTTAQGEAFATMLAVFAQMEAAAISARVKGARAFLLGVGRYAGGALPYGYRSVPNPEGKGFIVTQDSEVIDYVREMVRRTQAGLSIYSTQQWLIEVGAPTPTQLRASRREEEDADLPEGERRTPGKVSEQWHYNSVYKIVTHPLLSGRMPDNPNEDRGQRERGKDYVRDEDGLPVVYEHLAVMSVGEWEAMQRRITEIDKPQRQPYATRRGPVDLPEGMTKRAQHSGVLSGLMWCGEHDEPLRMRRGSIGSHATNVYPSYKCVNCWQTISNAEHLIVAEFLATHGHLLRMRQIEEVIEGGSAQYEAATIRLAELGRELATAEPERMTELIAQIQRLKQLQEEARDLPPQVISRPVDGPERTYAEDWAAATTDEERREIIGQALDKVIVRRAAARGSRSDANKLARLTFTWLPHGDLTPNTSETMTRDPWEKPARRRKSA
jgi:DNA invertase Pin-like site-specific DNA recombinase